MSERKGYPNPVDFRVGCKVSWNYYDNEDDAKACSEAAKYNAVIARSQGYDFGYCAPGSITKMRKGEYEGMWEVCLP